MFNIVRIEETNF